MKTNVIVFPFDLFGSGGTANGAQLLADGLRETIADNRREKMPTRASAYQDQLRVREFHFETLRQYQQWRSKARQKIRRCLRHKEPLLWLTGNHLGVLPVYDELALHFPDTSVIQFDAHLDVYNLTDCTDELSHGNFLLHCAGPLPALANVGHRELLLPAAHLRQYYKHTFPADQFAARPDDVTERLRRFAQNASALFIDLDCDVFDPAYFPALSHPLPFGLHGSDLLRLLDAVWSDKVIGLAISEFDPARDINDRSLATILWLIEFLLLKRYEK